MLSDRTKIETVKSYLRRTYPVSSDGSIATLQSLATQAYASATSSVTLTSTSSEGGSQSGQITFEKMSMLAALEELLAEYGNAGIPRSRVIIPDYRFASAV